MRKKIIVDLGCGKQKYPKGTPRENQRLPSNTRVIGLDINKTEDVDVVCNLEKGIPLASGSVDMIFCRDFIEHMSDVTFIMSEIRRVLKVGGICEMVIPHFSCFQALTDPTHKHYFGFNSFDRYAKTKNPSLVSKSLEDSCAFNEPKFVYETKELVWTNYKPFRFLNTLLNPILNFSPEFYERFFTFIFPCERLHIKMRKIK